VLSLPRFQLCERVQRVAYAVARATRRRCFRNAEADVRDTTRDASPVTNVRCPSAADGLPQKVHQDRFDMRKMGNFSWRTGALPDYALGLAGIAPFRMYETPWHGNLDASNFMQDLITVLPPRSWLFLPLTLYSLYKTNCFYSTCNTLLSSLLLWSPLSFTSIPFPFSCHEQALGKYYILPTLLFFFNI